MNYGDPAQQQQQQQQQYFVQRVPQQTQRMAFPPQQQMQQPSAGAMVVPQQQQQQAQQQQQSRQTMVYPSPHQQQQMMRMPAQHIYNTQQQQQGMGTQQQQQQQQFKNFLQSLPPGLQAQINAEKDPERKKQIIHLVHSQRQQHQQQMFEQQQQQHMAMMGAQGGTVHNQPGPMAMRPMAAQRMPMVQPTNGTTSIIFATTTNAQPMPQQSAQNVHFQRIPSQSSFVTHSSSPTPMGTANNYQPRVSSASSHASQMFMSGQQQQMPGGGAQIRAVTTTAPGTVNQSQQFVQQQQQMSQQQFHRQQQQQQFEQMPVHMAAQQQIKSDNGMVGSYQIGTPTAPSAGDSGAASQNRMTTSTIVVKTESGLTTAMGSTSVRTPAGAIDGPPSADSHPPSVGTANGMATGRPGSVQQQSGTAASQVDTEEPEYKMLLKKLCKYHADVKRLLGRFELDTLPGVEMKIKASLVNVIQVMEGTRKGGPVTKTLLQKLLSNVQTVLERHHISRHLFSIAKKLSTLAPPHNGTSANGGGGTTPTTAPKEEPFETDPWRNVRHMTIKLPDSVMTILEDEKKGTAAEKQPKKADDGGPETADSESGGKEWTVRKRIRQQNEDGKGEGPPAKKSLLERVAESFEAAQNPALPSVENEHSLSTSASEQQQKQPDRQHRHFRISCLDGTELVLKRTISVELSKAIGMGFAVHTEGTDIEPPISRNSPAIQIRFEWRGSGKMTKGEKEETSFLSTTTSPCSLDVLMPVSFPDAPLELFLHHHQLATAVPSPQMECLMDKIDSGTVDMYSLDALLSEWANCTDSLTDEDTDNEEH